MLSTRKLNDVVVSKRLAYIYFTLVLVLRYANPLQLIGNGYRSMPKFSMGNTPNHLFHNNGLEELADAMTHLGISGIKVERIMHAVEGIGVETTAELLSFSRDFVDRPEVLSKIFQDDFKLSVIDAHSLRSAMMHLLKSQSTNSEHFKSSVASRERGADMNRISVDFGLPKASIVASKKPASEDYDELPETTAHVEIATPRYLQLSSELTMSSMKDSSDNVAGGTIDKPARLSYAKFIVSRRKKKEVHPGPHMIQIPDTTNSDTAAIDYSDHLYGLKKTDMPKRLSQEMEEFELFMTDQNAKSQEPVIRLATAEVYVRHCRLFLGWYISQKYDKSKNSDRLDDLSVYEIFPNKQRESAQVIFDFVKWLRAERQISVSYEANLLRGLTKFCKYRFAKESIADPSYGEKSFEDIPMIKELRKLHRDANKKQKLAPRVSDEKKKWITWEEFLQVVQTVKEELENEIEKFNNMSAAAAVAGNSVTSNRTTNITRNKSKAANALKLSRQVQASVEERQKKNIATLFQRYLLLAFYTCIPDRQRTFRELEIGRTFIRQDESNTVIQAQNDGSSQRVNWIIKHGVDDYKTGKSYGERPPLMLSHALTPAIDTFITHWRPLLKPTSLRLFVQPKTGNPLTRDSVYDMVSRNCFRITGKKTNPHLLRDIIVTHVRNTAASERELEALALYMGHSIAMQRSSYDRRTLAQKVSPAVSLLESISMQAASSAKTAVK